MALEDDPVETSPTRLWDFIRHPAVSTALVFGLLFLVFGILENAYLESRSRGEIRRELRAHAEEMAASIKTDPWSLSEYRRYPFTATDFVLCTNTGLLLDLAGEGSSLLPTVTIPEAALSGSPTSIHSEVGEDWRVLLRRVKGGYVVVGTTAQADLKEADAKLAQQSLALGDDVAAASAKGRRVTETYVDFGAVGEGGRLYGAEGGLPLRTDPRFLEGLLDREDIQRIGGRHFLIQGKRLTDPSGRLRAILLLPREIGATEKMLRGQQEFVAWSLFVLWLLSEIFFVIRFRIRYRWQSLERALQEGEGERIEFKGSFKLDEGKTQRDYVKSIAGFLNSRGGTLFVGVDDAGCVCGIESDLERFGGSSDRLMQAVVGSLSAALGRDALTLVSARFERSGGRLVCRFDVKPAREPVFTQERDGSRTPLWVRIGNTTQPLTAEEAVRYAKERRRS